MRLRSKDYYSENIKDDYINELKKFKQYNHGIPEVIDFLEVICNTEMTGYQFLNECYSYIIFKLSTENDISKKYSLNILYEEYLMFLKNYERLDI